MINAENYEHRFFLYAEGLLPEEERIEVEAYMAAHPELAEELALYAEAPRLEADKEGYDDKYGLKHKSFGGWRYAAAAVLAAVAIGLPLLLSRHQEEPAPLAASLPQPTAVEMHPSQMPAAPYIQDAPRHEECVHESAVPALSPAPAEAAEADIEVLAEEPPMEALPLVAEALDEEDDTLVVIWVDDLITYIEHMPEPTLEERCQRWLLNQLAEGYNELCVTALDLQDQILPRFSKLAFLRNRLFNPETTDFIHT